MKLSHQDIDEFIKALKDQLSLPSYSYAQLSFLLKKFSSHNDENSIHVVTHLNLLMALFYYANGSHFSFKKYFLTAQIQSKKIRYGFQFIIESLGPVVDGGSKAGPIGIFSEAEVKLLNILKTEKLDKHGLIEKLYGDGVDFFVAENRLKNLIFRIRKKQKGLIICKDGFFELTQEMRVCQKSS